MQDALRTLLRQHAAVIAAAGARVEWIKRPQKSELPAIVLHQVSTVRGYTQKGRDGLPSWLVQIDCWGATPKAARDAARAVVTALDAVPTEALIAAFVENERSDDDAGQAGQPDFFRTSLDVRVWAPEA